MNTALTIDQLQNLFIQEMDLADTTKSVYKYCIRLFFRWMSEQGRNPRQPTRVDVMQYKTSLKATKSPLTTDLYMNSLKSFFKWLDMSGVFTNVTTHIRNEKRVAEFTKKPITIAQVYQLINSITPDNVISLRDRALISLLYFNALRLVETWRLDIRDVELNNSQIYIIGKGRTQREAITINDIVKQYLAEYINAIHTAPHYPLFHAYHHNTRNEIPRISIKYLCTIVSARMQAAGIKESKVSAHSLRHSAAVHMIDAGADLYTVQLFLRHTDSNVSRVYTRYAERNKMHTAAPTISLQNNYQALINQHAKNIDVI